MEMHLLLYFSTFKNSNLYAADIYPDLFRYRSKELKIFL